MKEVDHQRHIKQSVIRQGGYSFKLSNQFSIGIPDLLIALPPFVPILAEVKTLGECGDDFSRQLGVSPKQKDELRKLVTPYRQYLRRDLRMGILLVHVVWQKQHRLIPLPWDAERLDGATVARVPELGKRQRGSNGEEPWYDMDYILSSIDTPTMKGI